MDKIFQEDLRQEITYYFSNNIGFVADMGTIWEAFKVVMVVVARGLCIAKQDRVLTVLRDHMIGLKEILRN